MNQTTARILAEVSVFIGLIPLLIAIINWKYANWNQKLLRILVLISVTTEISAWLISAILKANNLALFHVFTIIEFFLITTIYKKELSSFLAPKCFNLLIIIFSVYSIINSLFIETLNQFNGYARAVSGIIIILFTLLYFYKLLKELKIKRLEKDPMFWLSTGLLVYFSASLFIFIFSNYIQPSVKLSFTFWGIHAILNISHYLFYAIALWIRTPKTV